MDLKANSALQQSMFDAYADVLTSGHTSDFINNATAGMQSSGLIPNFQLLLDKGDIRVLEQTDGVLEESAGLINGLQHAQPNLIGGFGTNNDVSTTVVSEVQPWASGVTMQRWISHNSIVDVLLLLVEAPDVYLEVQHPCWSCNSNSSSANASAGVR